LSHLLDEPAALRFEVAARGDGVNLSLENGLLRGRFRGSKLVCYASARMTWKNRLYFGDNLKILREYLPEASIDLHPRRAKGLHP
jgi:hypothetical protein